MKRILIITGIVLAFVALFAFNKMTTRNEETNTYVKVKKDVFEISVSASGELIAEKSIDIKGPEIVSSAQGNRGMRFMDLKIQDLVPEGTLVRQGEYIAQLDRSSYSNSLKDAMDALKTEQANLEMKILDTAVALSGLRDDIKNQHYVVEEAQITLAQSKFEPPATIRQAEIALDKAKRALEQKNKGYSLKIQQNLADIGKQKRAKDKAQSLVDDLQDFLSKFTVLAPTSGMVIYKKDFSGTKRKTGSSVNPFDRIIATLPDLSSMLSKIYVNEIEVSKVKPGQKVTLAVDAFPSKSYAGKVISIANIGETLPNSDSKMFEVQIRLDVSDPALRPSMTTTNKIIISTYNDALFIPTECVQTGSDSIPFVYLKNKTRQVVVLGEANDKNVLIKKGLEPGIMVCVTTPADPQGYKLRGQELIPEIKKH